MFRLRGFPRKFHRNFSQIKENFRNSTKVDSTHLSRCSGSTEIQLLTAPIGTVLSETAINFPNRIALISSHQNVRLTYAAFDKKVTEVAKALLALGLKRNIRQVKVGVYAPNSEEWVLLQFACARIGYILVNINPLYQSHDLEYVLKKVEIGILVMPSSLRSLNYLNIMDQVTRSEIKKTQDKENLYIPNLPDLSAIVLLGDEVCGEGSSLMLSTAYQQRCEQYNMIPWEEFYHFGSRAAIGDSFKQYRDSVSVYDAVNIQFTSGTTGLPKGAVLSHYNIVNNGYLVGNVIGLKHEESRVLIQVPLYHCFGTVMGNLACITHGATMVYPNGVFDAAKSLQVIEAEKITSLYGVPTMFYDILALQRKEQRNITSLSNGIMAGAICPKSLMDRCTNELNLRNLTIAYGMTELAPVTHQTSPHDTIEKKTTSVGTLLPHTETKIVNENGEVVPRGVIGEICTRGYGVMLGYYGDLEATAKVIDPEGYMRTGDLGLIDKDGYLHIEGRSKDIIIRGGENISPKEVEDFILSMPKVENVQVIGIKSEKFGEEVCAWVVPKDEFKGTLSKEDITLYCKGKLANYKIPRYVRFVDSFPLTVTGKIQKFKMREITNEIIENKSEFL